MYNVNQNSLMPQVKPYTVVHNKSMCEQMHQFINLLMISNLVVSFGIYVND